MDNTIRHTIRIRVLNYSKKKNYYYIKTSMVDNTIVDALSDSYPFNQINQKYQKKSWNFLLINNYSSIKQKQFKVSRRKKKM